MKRLMMILLAMFFTANAANAGTLSDIQTATGGTYLDFEFEVDPFDGVDTRDGLTATTTGSGWGFPDGSVGAGGADGINSTGMDSFGSGGNEEFQVNVTGLADLDYTLWIVAVGHAEVETFDWGFHWGTVSGSLTEVSDIAAASGAINITNSGTTVDTWAAPVGSVTPIGGSVTLFIDNMDTAAGRTLIDGIALIEVPEPTAMLLLGLGSLAVVRRRK